MNYTPVDATTLNALDVAAQYARNVDAYHAEIREIEQRTAFLRADARRRFDRAQVEVVNHLQLLVLREKLTGGS